MYQGEYECTGILEFGEYMNGTHPELENTTLKKIASQLNQRNARYFVKERVARKLEGHGFIVKCHVKQIGQWNLEVPQVGEIDVLATKVGDKKLVIGECKFSGLPDIHVRQMRRDLTDYMEESSGYRDKLERKTKWVSGHIAEVMAFMEIEAV